MEGKECLYIELVLHRSQEILFPNCMSTSGRGKSGSAAPMYTKSGEIYACPLAHLQPHIEVSVYQLMWAEAELKSEAVLVQHWHYLFPKTWVHDL